MLATEDAAGRPESELQEETKHDTQSSGIDPRHAVAGIPRNFSNDNSMSVLEVDTASGDTDDDSAISGVNALGEWSDLSSIQAREFDTLPSPLRSITDKLAKEYILPNDTTEQERLDLQHHLLLVLLGKKLYLAPITSDAQNVLDVGTGTGIWAIEFAIQHPYANVIGSDLSPIQSDYVPSNCRFEIDDAEDEWTYSTKFDFIHMRGMMTCFAEPRSIIAKAYNALASGGYLEMQDGVFPMQCDDDTLLDTPLDIWSKACVDGAAKLGRPWTNTPNYKRWMEELGFEDVQEKIFKVPTGPWAKGKKAKELGLWFSEDLWDAAGATAAVMIRGLGWAPDKVDNLIMEVKECLKKQAIHSWMPIHVVYGRKPKE